MVIEKKCRLPLKEILKDCCSNFPQINPAKAQEILLEIEAFIINRIRSVFLDYGFEKSEIEASLFFGFTEIYDTFCKVNALHRFRKNNPQFGSLLEVYKRAKGQLADQAEYPFSEQLMKEEAEKKLDEALREIQPQFEKAIAAQDYDRAYELIALLQPPLAALFEQVKILAEDSALRNNRLGLLQRVFALFAKLVDFSKLV
jgi:glycyl-tRNA synthetase